MLTSKRVEYAEGPEVRDEFERTMTALFRAPKPTERKTAKKKAATGRKTKKADKGIRIHRAAMFYFLKNRILQGLALQVGDNVGANLPQPAIQNAKDSRLADITKPLALTAPGPHLESAAAVHLLGSRPDEHFVALDRTAF